MVQVVGFEGKGQRARGDGGGEEMGRGFRGEERVGALGDAQGVLFGTRGEG